MTHEGDFILIMNKHRRGRAGKWIGTHQITADIKVLRAYETYNDEEDSISKSGIKLVKTEAKSLVYVPSGRRHGGVIYRIESDG